MDIKLPLNEMSVEDKLRVMEPLWIDLTKNEAEYSSPSWHSVVLKVREQRVEAGYEDYEDWEIAKNELRKS
jgi:hypothetical protein